MEYTLSLLEKKFSKLRVDSNKDRYTAGKAPHKAVLLISLMILDSDNRINLNSFNPDIYLRDVWKEIWQKMEYESPGSITQPLYHMKSEGFWNFEKAYNGRPPSLSKFNELCGNISISSDVADLMHNHRNELIETLLNSGYFSENEASAIAKLIPEIENSFVYERQAESELTKEFVIDPVMNMKRNPAFRRMVLSAYDETCSVCGMKVIASSGISVMDAAHILPFSKFHNDDCRNGLTLCKLHHWMFDQGLISVDDCYRVNVSKDIEDAPEEVSSLHKSEIILPEDELKLPAKAALGWHRENVFIK